MAEKQFIKFYTVKPTRENINKFGKLNKDAQLQPLYHNYYGIADNSIGEVLNKPIEYDNSKNKHPDRKYTYFDHQDKEEPGIKKEVKSPDGKFKRGFSANSLFNTERIDKVESDKGDIMVHGNIPNRKMIDDEVYLRTGTVDQSDKKRIDDDLYNFDMESLSNLWNARLDGENYQLAPLIVSTDDSNIINYNDIREKGYSPKRDDANEVIITKIDKRELPKNFKFDVKTAEEIRDKLSSFIRYALICTKNILEITLDLDKHPNRVMEYTETVLKSNKQFNELWRECNDIAEYLNYTDSADKGFVSSISYILEKLRHTLDEAYQGSLHYDESCFGDYYYALCEDEDFEVSEEEQSELKSVVDHYVNQTHQVMVEVYDDLKGLLEESLFHIKEPKKYFIGHNKTKTETEMKQYFPQDEIYSDENIKNVREEK